MSNGKIILDESALELVKEVYDLGGSSIIEIPSRSRLTLDGNKLLQLLIAKGVDVDAEIEDYYSYDYYSGLLLGGTIDASRYLHNNVSTNAIFPCVEYNGGVPNYGIKWVVCQSSATYTVKHIEHIEHITFKTMLQALGTVDVEVFNEIKLVPYVALKTSSQSMSQPVSMTNDEFLSFITIIPANEQKSQE